MNDFKPRRSWRWLSLLFAAWLGLSAVSVSAQEKEVKVSGQVLDAKNEPVVGAAVYVEGTSKGTTTDVNGNFTLLVKPGAVVTVKYIGFRTREIPASQLKGAKVFLTEDATQLDDVVVVGYGVRKKETLTGAVSNIANKELMTTTHSSLAQNLQGKVAGLQIRQNSGEPGDFNTMINIRGFGNPLYVIDGIPQDMGGNDFQRLNPQDIESISIIKDASAAVYGLKAANGVVIVTTNRGRKGKTKFNYNMTYGWQKPTDMPRMANRSEWAQMRNEANLNAGGTPYFTREELAREMAGATTDWYGLTMRDFSTQQQHNLSASGGTDKITYYVSLGYVQENGLLRSKDLNYNKYTFRSNLTAKLAKNFSADVNISGRYDTKNSPSAGYHDIFYGTRTALPNTEAYANGNPEYLGYQRFINPIAIADSDISGYTQNKNQMLTSSLSLKYDVPFVKGLSVKAVGAFDNNRLLDKSLTKEYKLYTYDANAEIPYQATKKNSPSKISNGNTDIDMLTLQGFLTYSRVFAEDHSLDATLVYEIHKYDSRTSTLGREYSFYTNDQIDQASLNNQTNSGMEEQQRNAALIGRLNYGFRDKYLVEFAFRYDGSYRYPRNQRWGFFPVVSAGWRISEEPFMKNVKFISNLKLRGSYGVLGEDSGSKAFQYITGYSLTGGGGYEFVNGTWTEGAASPAIVNERLTWYTSHTADIGIDLGLLSNRLAFEFDVYQRDRKGLMADRLVSLPNTFGGTLPQENLNSDRVRGLDLSVAYNDRFGDFYLSVRGNFNFARTMNRHVEHAPYANSMDRWRNGVDNRWGDFAWGYVVENQFTDEESIIFAPLQNGANGNTLTLPGDYRYKDVNGDGVIDGKDMMPIFYNGSPKLYYGLTLSAAWKGFDFSAVLQGSGRYTVRFKEVYAEMLAFDLNTPAYFFDRWHREDPYDPNSAWIPGKWPATRLVTDAGSIYNESEIWRKDASYLRMKSMELGYTIPAKYLKKIGIEGIRVYFTAHNVFTITDPFVKAFDPEKIEGANSSGFTYPLTRSYNLGININF